MLVGKKTDDTEINEITRKIWRSSKNYSEEYRDTAATISA